MMSYINRRLPWRSGALVGAATLALAAAGCGDAGPQLAPVRGRVTLDGQPLAGARIRFQPEASGASPSYGTADQDGRYELGYKRGQNGAMIGWHTIRIESQAERKPLPARYNERSKLRQDVKAGEDNVIDFKLSSEGS